MFRSLVAVAVSLLLAVPVAAQSQYTALPSERAPATVRSASSDSATTEASETNVPPEESWERAERAFDDHVVDGVGRVDRSDGVPRRLLPTYRDGPPIRYNRVEGLVLGLRRDPLTLGSQDRARIHGQVSYAFGVRDVRYTVGVESQLVQDANRGLKIGVTYQEQTLTPDRWKTSFAENSLAGFGFGYDYFDYYEAEGVSVYAVHALPHTVRLTAGFRSEMHRPSARQTTWSLFGGGSFRPNPAATQGRLHAAFVGLQGGHIRDLDGLPTGAAFRLAANIGEPFGGDLLVNRYQAQGRAFVRLTTDTRLGLRLRGGYATSEAPIQTQFALGGIGSVRSYGQNAVRGTRMLLGNVEYIVDGATVFDHFLDDLYLVGLLDAGWVGGADSAFRTEDVLPSAGFSVGLDEREVRVDVTWPLKSMPAAGSGPSIWLRITPNF